MSRKIVQKLAITVKSFTDYRYQQSYNLKLTRFSIGTERSMVPL